MRMPGAMTPAIGSAAMLDGGIGTFAFCANATIDVVRRMAATEAVRMPRMVAPDLYGSGAT
jgi:hypothetical protein